MNYREELTIDYKWDKNLLNIPNNVACLCEKPKCRKYLMKSIHEKNRADDELLINHSNREGYLTVKKEELPGLLSPSKLNDFSETLS